MQYNNPPRRSARTNAATPSRYRSQRDYTPKKRKSKFLSILPLLLLFVTLLAVMYAIFPKQAGRHVGASAYDGLVISEVMAANSSAVPDENGEFYDWMELYNGTGADLNMEGVMITNRTDRITFPFPSYVLKAGDRVVIFASDSYQLDPSLPFHGKFKISSAGDHIYLYDPEMYLIDELATPTLTADTSYVLTDVDEDGVRHYETTSYYSPGYENSESGFSAYRTANAIESGALVINEVCPDPRLSIPDETGEIVDWIELKNNTDHTIPLSGCYLSDKENKPMKWRFPDGASIPAGGYYLVYASGKDIMQANGIPHTNFSLSAERESVVLSDERGRLIDRVSFENVPEDQSYGRSDVGDWRLFQLPTPSQPNNSAGQARVDDIYRAYNPTGVYLSEVLASNDTIALGAASLTTDYLELYNASAETVDLSNYGLSDNLKRPRRWQFPESATIAPGEYKIVYLDGNPQLTTVTDYHTNFKIKRAGGETVSFCDPTGRVLDRIPLSLIPTDHSYGRTTGYSGFYYYDIPTPGTANGTGYFGYTANPTFSMPGGEYKGSVDVTISVPEFSMVYYTTDGSIPTPENGMPYNGEGLTISRVTVLRARAFDTGGMLQPSETVTATYLLNLYHAFPVVSLVTDPVELWNEENGMLTTGGELDKSKQPFKRADGSGEPNYRKYGKDARPGHVEYYEQDGTTVLNQDCEFGLQGQFSLDLPQKSFKVRAKAKYGQKYFEAQLFEDRPFTQYKSFVLRMSGNDGMWTRMADGLQGRLIDLFNELHPDNPSTVIHQAWKPVVVYLNGVYWGHYNLRERADRFFVAQHEGLTLEEADNMDVLEASAQKRMINWGTNKEYLAMIDRVKKSSPGKNEEDLQYILDNIDVDNYFDYMAFEMFFGNSDPGNIRFYKLHGAGQKWKWIIFDLDYGLFDSKFNSPKSYLKKEGAGSAHIDNTLIRKLLENDEMKHKFLTRLGEVFQTFTTPFMLEQIDLMQAILEPEMEMHFSRWAEEVDKAIMADNPTTPEGALRYWNTRVNRLRNVVKKRPNLFWEMVRVEFDLTEDQMVLYFGARPEMPADAE